METINKNIVVGEKIINNIKNTIDEWLSKSKNKYKFEKEMFYCPDKISYNRNDLKPTIIFSIEDYADNVITKLIIELKAL